jgi:hypothetical protein
MANRERGEDVTVCTVKHLSGQDDFRESFQYVPKSGTGTRPHIRIKRSGRLLTIIDR